MFQSLVDSPQYVYDKASDLYQNNTIAFVLILIVVLLVVYYLVRSVFGYNEGFSTVQRWPFLPKPKYWDSSRYFHWDPWYIYDFGYFPATPEITTYDMSTYKFPPEILAKFKKPETVVPEETPVLSEGFRNCSSCRR